MYYCTNCHRVTPERAESCPYCDKFDRLRPAEEADECRLTELDALNASVLESLLKEANVPYIARPMMGAGISAALGVTLEKFVFFVAYRDYARAQEQLEALLAPSPFWRPFIPLSVALLRCVSFTLARMKNSRRILAHSYLEIV